MLQVFVNFILWLLNRLTGLVMYPLFVGFQSGFNFDFSVLSGYLTSYILFIRNLYHCILSMFGINNYVFTILTGFFVSYILVLTSMRIIHWFINIYNLLKF